ncbi:MAG TPA: alkaline phosphatase PhoX [Solirubrobacteraceae bacterium]|nr:alkaline phosphatase PhoX [Solirubrobacteraceae bacterium]
MAQAGAGTFAAAALLDAAGVDLLADAGAVPGGRTEFSRFRAIAASSADAVEVPAGYRADVLISWGDEFGRPDGTTFTYGFNNDFLAFLPLRGKPDEGLLFVNHEYPSPFFLHGQEDAAAKTAEQLAVERYSVGNSVLHVRRPRGGGAWQVIESPFNRRITGDAPVIAVTGPLAGRSGLTIQGEDGPFQVEVGAGVAGSLANCSGGVTPWSTVLSCEENFQDYGADNYGWGGRYEITSYADYGWVVEHDPYDPASTPRKHTALGRFRHENAAYRHVRGKRFVLYMGDDSRNEGVYKFVSDRRFVPGDRANNLRILESGTLYIARWAPEGRRRFREYGDTRPITPAEGRGRWVPVREEDLVDTARNLRARFGTDTFDEHFATNRPEDLEVGRDGSVYIAFTNNDADGVNDAHGAIRRLRETDDDPTATTFTWRDYASGGPTNRRGRGTRGFSSCDNLVFDEAGNLWIVTDISSSSLRGSTEPKREYAYHRNNAVFMIPRSGPNRGVAFRFANMPVEAEGTGPYFTPDGSTLFINVQHPGEETPSRDGARPDDPQTFSSWWPDGNRTAGTGTPSKPRPSTVMVTREAGR